MHSILKDGSYIQYGLKIIPNPNAEGGGGSGGGDISTFKINIEVYDTAANELVNYTFLELGYFYTDIKDDFNSLQFSFQNSAPEDHIYNAPAIGDMIEFEWADGFISAGDGENVWLNDTEAGIIRSVSGNAAIEGSSVIITGDCTITCNVIPD